jgi:hypothetical protein
MVVGLIRRWAFLLFVLLFTAAILYRWIVPQAALELSSGTVHLLGYWALGAMALPYLHVGFRRVLRHRRRFLFIPLGHQVYWLEAHILGAYLGFALTVVHSGGRAGTWLTWWILVLFWVVMLTGVIGYWGERWVYRLVVLAVEPEYGRARARTRERLRLLRRGRRIIQEYWKFTEYDIQDWRTFCQALLDEQSLLHQPVWQKLLKISKIADALQAVRLGAQLAEGEAAPVSMNPVIGALNQLIATDNAELSRYLAEPISEQNIQQKADAAKQAALANNKGSAEADAAATKERARLEREKQEIDALQAKLQPMQKDRVERSLQRARELGPEFARLETARELNETLRKGLAEKKKALPPEPKETTPRNRLLRPFLRLLTALGKVRRREEKRRKELRRAEKELNDQKKEYDERGKALRSHRNRLLLQVICPQIEECEEPTGLLKDFFKEVEPRLEKERVPWGWLFKPQAQEAVPHNVARRIRAVLSSRQHRALDQLVKWLERKRRLDLEIWLDRLATAWLGVHGIAALVLLVLVIDHVLGSIRFGGF